MTSWKRQKVAGRCTRSTQRVCQSPEKKLKKKIERIRLTRIKDIYI